MADRPEPVPCINATKYEVENGKHLTRNMDRHCNSCQTVLDKFAAARKQAEAIEAAENADREDDIESDDEYARWNTGECARCGGAGILGAKNKAHPSVYGMDCPDCMVNNDPTEGA